MQLGRRRPQRGSVLEQCRGGAVRCKRGAIALDHGLPPDGGARHEPVQHGKRRLPVPVTVSQGGHPRRRDTRADRAKGLEELGLGMDPAFEPPVALEHVRPSQQDRGVRLIGLELPAVASRHHRDLSGATRHERPLQPCERTSPAENRDEPLPERVVRLDFVEVALLKSRRQQVALGAAAPVADVDDHQQAATAARHHSCIDGLDICHPASFPAEPAPILESAVAEASCCLAERG